MRLFHARIYTLSALKEQIIRTIFLCFVLKNINAFISRAYIYRCAGDVSSLGDGDASSLGGACPHLGATRPRGC